MTLLLPLACGHWDAASYARTQVQPLRVIRGEVSPSTWLAQLREIHPVDAQARLKVVIVDAQQRYLPVNPPAAGLARHELDRVIGEEVQLAFFLGIDGRDVLIGVVLATPMEGMRGLRGAARSGELDCEQSNVSDLIHTDLQLLATSVGLAAWHERAAHCGVCGQSMTVAAAGWERHCHNCQAVEYPRTDPSVIVAITDAQDRLLLAHNRAWRPGYASLVAGFVEMGESPEQAVRREVAEEVGVVIPADCPITYVASQAWPFPRSLMLGFAVRLPAAVVSLHVDGEELDWARFFSREHYREAVNDGTIEKPTKLSIARAMIDAWLEAPALRGCGQ